MPITDAQSANLYIECVVMQAKADVCTLDVDGFQAEFSRRFSVWRDANADALERGRKQTEATNRPGGATVQDFAVMNAQVLASLPADDRLRRCRELLVSLPEVTAP